MKQLFRLPYSLSLISILFFSTLVRLFNLGYPAEFVFDERYHVPAVNLIAENDVRAFEWWHQPIKGTSNHDWLHPPLAKYIQAYFYNLGEGSVISWRIGSVIFGLIGIILVYVLSSLLTNNQLNGLLAALFLSLDGLWLVQSRIAMNDVFVSVFLLVVAISYWLFTQYKKKIYLLLTGLFLGLALATKWTALFVIIGLLSFELIKVFRDKKTRFTPFVIFSLLIVPLGVYLLSYLPIFLAGKDFNFLIDLHKNIIYYQIHRDALHPYQSTPGQWIFNLRSVWYWTNGETQNIYLLNNPLLVVFYLTALLIAFVQILQNKNKKVLSFLLFFYGLSFSSWVFSPRILFYYHYLPAIPFVAIILAIIFKDVYFKLKKSYIYLLLISVVCLIFIFWLYYPLWIGLPAPYDLQQALYWLLPSWK